MEIPLVFRGDKDADCDSEFVSFCGTYPVVQLRNEIQKRLLMTGTSFDLKLLLELNGLIENIKAARKEFDIHLFKYEGLTEYLWVTQNPNIPNGNYVGPSLLQLLREKFGQKFGIKAKCQFVDSRMETPTLISYSTEKSGLELDGNLCAKLTFKECKPCPELKDMSDFKRPILSLILCFESGAPKRKLTDPNPSATVNQKMLKMELATDVIIVSGGGKEFKCHKSFLFAHSPVLQAMLLSGMEETRTSRIEVPDLSEEVVEAFLQYLYFKDTSKVRGDFELCFGLLYAAHKYEVKCLEGHAIELLQSLKIEDYPLEMALKLFLFLGSAIPGSEELKKRTASIMKKKFDALTASPEYVDLFKTNPEGAMELTKYLVDA